MTQTKKPRAPRSLSELGALRVLDPKAWAKKIEAAMRASHGRVPAAAEALGISSRQLFRALDDPLLKGVDRAKTGRPPDDE